MGYYYSDRYRSKSKCSFLTRDSQRERLLKNVWFVLSKSSYTKENVRCHACDGQMVGGGKWRIGQYSGGPKTAILTFV